MADMDTYDNEPRTYDGMDYTYYEPHARRRIRSYADLAESYHSSSDPWFRSSEGEFNINPHCGRRACAFYKRGHQLTSDRLPARR